MNTQIILSGLLTLHITGLVLMAGTTVVDFITFKTFWKLFDQEKEKSISLLNAISGFSILIRIGIALLILTGIGMMGLTHGVFGEMIWFRIKFALVIILILNFLLVGRRQGLKLRKIINENGPRAAQQINKVRINLNRFHLFQLAIFFTIVLLSVFKFN